MNELLSASSIFLAVLGLLYSSWYSDISKALNITIPTFKDDRKKVKKFVEEILKYRILPIAIGSTVLTMIIFPKIIKIIYVSFNIYKNLKFAGIKYYNAVDTLVVAFFFFSVGFSLHTINLTRKIKKKFDDIRK